MRVCLVLFTESVSGTVHGWVAGDGVIDSTLKRRIIMKQTDQVQRSAPTTEMDGVLLDAYVVVSGDKNQEHSGDVTTRILQVSL